MQSESNALHKPSLTTFLPINLNFLLLNSAIQLTGDTLPSNPIRPLFPDRPRSLVYVDQAPKSLVKIDKAPELYSRRPEAFKPYQATFPDRPRSLVYLDQGPKSLVEIDKALKLYSRRSEAFKSHQATFSRSASIVGLRRPRA